MSAATMRRLRPFARHGATSVDRMRPQCANTGAFASCRAGRSGSAGDVAPHLLGPPPGYHVVEDLIAEGDRVVGKVTAYGKHTGELFGISATGRDIRVTGIAIWRITDGKIVEHWHQTDQFGLMLQLGVISPLGG